MSFWSTRSSGIDRDYIVLKHTIKGVNYVINGVRFRDSFAVVEKNSKTLHLLRKVPVLRSAEELPLLILKDLPFITRPSDVRTIYGQDVYTKFIVVYNDFLAKKAEKEHEMKEELHLQSEKCKYRTVLEELCKHDSLDVSPSGYCRMHILEDPKLQELDVYVPRFMVKKERPEYKEKVISELTKLKAQGKF